MSESRKESRRYQKILFLFYRPSCAICENLLKSASFKRLRQLLARGNGIKLELYNAEDGSIGESLADLFDVDFVPCLVDPFAKEKKTIPFRSISELENILTHEVGYIERVTKQKKENEKKKKMTQKIRILQAIKQNFPTQWFTLDDIRRLLPGIPDGTIKRTLHEFKEDGILAYDPFEHKYKYIAGD